MIRDKLQGSFVFLFCHLLSQALKNSIRHQISVQTQSRVESAFEYARIKTFRVNGTNFILCMFTTDKSSSTGATGYIGGDALYAIATAHPEYEITALVRNSQKGALVAKQYPRIKLAYGDLDSDELIEEESRKADIVCRMYILHCSFASTLPIHIHPLFLFSMSSPGLVTCPSS